MISNYFSLLLAVVELFGFTGICFGYSFLQFIFMDELILHKEKCQVNDVNINGTLVLCEEALAYYNFIFSCCIISSSVGVVFFGIFEVKAGQMITRTLCNLCTTFGLLLLTFYRTSGYFIMAGWTIMSTPAIYYITSNCCLVPFFLKYAGMLVVQLVALFDMSPGLFLLFKLAYQSTGTDLRLMLQLLTAASSIIWIRTLFLMPVYRSDPSKTLFEQSFFGQLIYTKQV